MLSFVSKALVLLLILANLCNSNTQNIEDSVNSQRFNSTQIANTSILTENEFRLFKESIDLIKDSKCKSDLNKTLNGLLAAEQWAIAMYDATVKSAFGIESGITHQFGHFDECLDQQHPNRVPVRSQYCLVDVTMNGLKARNIDTRNAEKLQNYTIAHWGACLPSNCHGDDIASLLQHMLQRPVSVDDDNACQMKSELIITDAMWIYALVICFFVFLAFLSTAYHIYLMFIIKQNDHLIKPAFRNETLTIALLSFSVIENTKKLFQASKEQLGLNSINGIKALSMLVILTGHALVFIYGGPAFNAEFVNEQIKTPTFAFLSNSLLFVDTFLLLSGFLFCRILLAELERRQGKINVLFLYIGRYIRLTPAYLAVIGFYVTWFLRISPNGGPIWQQRILREQQRCEESWWLNILYINNYINTDKLCMFQSWYLCVDSQLFFLAPIGIYLLNKSRKYGLWLLSLMAIVTAIVPFVETARNNLDPTLMVYKDEINDLASNPFYVGFYIKTHIRASAYVIGLLTGYCVHIMQERGTKLPKFLVCGTWLVAIVVGMSSMYTVSLFYSRPSYTSLESIMYAGFHKIGWNLAVAWLVLAATTGHAGFLQAFLSSRIFAPLSRLTYCAYLSNGIVELYHSSIIRSPEYMSYINLTNSVFGHIVNTFTLALFLCLLFESPIHALERILLRSFGGGGRKEFSKQQASNSQTPSTSEEHVA